ncbi:MAG TPA: DeoR/GlpR family DNA-binding transcription regulator [Egibacteraceae bacterium]|jgi:DeoR family transcriptional regulator, fructose operon transcriptional repressor|nr:DeoR/GlpR family DNA-binding transcription regulator [Egibacteraceae bacterium]
MYAPERQQEILRRARAVGRVDVATLAGDLAVTSETVRRDLDALERQGLLRRVHGGALPVERLRFEPGVAERAATMAAEKERIAKVALDYLPREGTILVDAGTTTARFAEQLPDDRELTVVTNALPIALTLSARPRLTVLTVGGRVRGRTLALVDRWALRSLGEIHVDVAFVAANGVSVGGGLTTPDLAEATVKEAMVAAADRVVLLADHTKVGVDKFCRFADIGAVDVFVTDAGVDDETAAVFRDAGVDMVRA